MWYNGYALEKGKTYRIIITYTGFDEEKDARITKAARKSPSQTQFDPVEARRSLDFTFGSVAAARNCRARIIMEQRNSGGFSVSKVIDDNF